MLIENGFSAKDVGKRVGHSAEKITYLYAHSYDERGKQMANKLDAIEGGDVGKKCFEMILDEARKKEGN